MPPLVREAALDMAVAARTRAPLGSGRALAPCSRFRCARGPPEPSVAGARSLRELVHAAAVEAAPGNPGDLIQRSFIAAGSPAPVPTVHCGPTPRARPDAASDLAPCCRRRCRACVPRGGWSNCHCPSCWCPHVGCTRAPTARSRRRQDRCADHRLADGRVGRTAKNRADRSRWVDAGVGEPPQLSRSANARATTFVARRRSSSSMCSSARLALLSSTVRGPQP